MFQCASRPMRKPHAPSPPRGAPPPGRWTGSPVHAGAREPGSPGSTAAAVCAACRRSPHPAMYHTQVVVHTCCPTVPGATAPNDVADMDEYNTSIINTHVVALLPSTARLRTHLQMLLGKVGEARCEGLVAVQVPHTLGSATHVQQRAHRTHQRRLCDVTQTVIGRVVVHV